VAGWREKDLDGGLKMNLEEAKEIGKIRKAAVPPISGEVERLAIEKERHLLKAREIEEQLDRVNRKFPQKVEVINQKEIQKVIGETNVEVKNWPDIFKVGGEVIAKVAFPVIQKITGNVIAKIENFPNIQKIMGAVTAEIENFPEVQKVEVTNPTQRMYVEGRQEVTNLPLGKSDKEGDPERFIGVRFTDGKRYYDLTDLVVAGGGGAMRREDEDIRWIREDFTYDANNNVTRVVSYDGQGFKKVTDYEYDASQNVTRKTSRFEKA
jgi:YD repeat-containing protein